MDMTKEQQRLLQEEEEVVKTIVGLINQELVRRAPITPVVVRNFTDVAAQGNIKGKDILMNEKTQYTRVVPSEAAHRKVKEDGEKVFEAYNENVKKKLRKPAVKMADVKFGYESQREAIQIKYDGRVDWNVILNQSFFRWEFEGGWFYCLHDNKNFKIQIGNEKAELVMKTLASHGCSYDERDVYLQSYLYFRSITVSNKIPHYDQGLGLTTFMSIRMLCMLHNKSLETMRAICFGAAQHTLMHILWQMKHGEKEYQKDLTKEGIEPNPGPISFLLIFLTLTAPFYEELIKHFRAWKVTTYNQYYVNLIVSLVFAIGESYLQGLWNMNRIFMHAATGVCDLEYSIGIHFLHNLFVIFAMYIDYPPMVDVFLLITNFYYSYTIVNRYSLMRTGSFITVDWADLEKSRKYFVHGTWMTKPQFDEWVQGLTEQECINEDIGLIKERVKTAGEWLKEGVELNPGPADFNYDVKEQRRLKRARQRDEKRDSLTVTYRNKFNSLEQSEKWTLTGDLEIDCYHFYELLLRQGYASNRIVALPTGVLRSLFTAFEEGYGLQQLQKVERKFMNNPNMRRVETYGSPEPGKGGRHLIVKYYFIHYYHHHKLLALLLQGKTDQMFEWFNGKLEGVGSTLAKGWMKEVKPVWDSVIAQVAGFKSRIGDVLTGFALGMGAVIVAVLLGLLGKKIIYKYCSILLPSLHFKTLELEDDPPEHVDQMFGYNLFSWSMESWLETMNVRANKLTAKFVGDSWEKKLKELGNFSAAMNNIFTFLGKIQSILKWVIDKSWKFITGVDFFQDTRDATEFKNRINAMVVTVSIKDIENRGLEEQKQFVKDYMDLREMKPFLQTVDPSLTASINIALGMASNTFLSIWPKIKFESTRMKPVWIYLVAGPNQGKSNFQHHFPRLFYQYLKEHDEQLYKDVEGPEVFSEAMIYKRNTEQEYWDRYNNQWVCIFDDLFQNKELKSAEAFSLIRARNDADYALHMAAIGAKENTSFRSKIIMSSTNMTEKEFDGFDGISDIRAVKRRRDFVVKTRLKPKDKRNGASQFDAEALDNWILEVYSPDPDSGAIDEQDGVVFEGAGEIMDFVRAVYGKYKDNFLEAQVKAKPADYGKYFVRKIPKMVTHGVDGDEIPKTTADKKKDLTTTEDDGTGLTPLLKKKDQCRFMRKKQVQPLDLDDAPPRAAIAAWKEFVKKLSIWKVSLHTYPTINVSYYLGYCHPSFIKAYVDLTGDKITRTKEHMLNTFAKMKDKGKTIFSDIRWSDGTFARYGVRVKTKLGEWSDNFLSVGVANVDDDLINCFLSYMMQNWDKFDVKTLDRIDFGTGGYIPRTSKLYAMMEQDKELKDILLSWGFVTHEQVHYFPAMVRNLHALYDFEKRHWDSICKYSKGKLATLIEKYDGVMIIASVAGIFAGIGITLLNLSPLQEQDTSYFTDQSNAKYLEKMRQKHIPKLKRPAPKVDQFQDDAAYQLAPIVWRNTYALEVQLDTGNAVCQFAVGLGNTIFVTASHMFKLKGIKKIILYPTKESYCPYERFFSELKYYIHEDSDVCFFSIPSTQHVKDISVHLPRKSDESMVGQPNVGRIDPPTSLGEKYEDYFAIVPNRSEICSYEKNELFDACSVSKALLTKIAHVTQAGDCGKMFILFNPKVQRKIAGIHVAGGQNDAIFSPVYYEDFINFRDEILKTKTIQDQFRYYELVGPLEHPDDPVKFTPCLGKDLLGMQYVGKVSQTFSWPHRTKLLKTPVGTDGAFSKIDGVVKRTPLPFEMTHRPAILQDKERDLIGISLRGLKEKRHVSWDEWHVKEYWEGIFNDKALRGSSGRLQTKEEAIAGSLKILNSHSISRNTSMAYCYQKEFGKKSKYVLTAQEHYDVLTEKEKKRFVKVGKEVWLDYRVDWKIDKFFECVKNKKIPAHMVLFCLKDEPRPNDRVDQAKTRAFFMGAFAEMIVTIMVLGDFISALEANNFFSDSAVGINPYSSAWDLMYQYLKVVGTKGIADDASQWDIHFQSVSFIDAFPVQYCLWYMITDEYLVGCVFAVVYINNAAYVVIGSEVYFIMQKFSGVLTTCIDNTVANSVENRIAIKIMFPDKKFEEICRMKVFGDDKVMTFVPGLEVDVGLFRHLLKTFFGYESTNCFKISGDNNMVELKDMEFLKRSFHEMDGRIYGRLNRESIHVMTQWMMEPTDKTVDAQFAVIVATAMMEIARYGEEDFEKYKKIFNGYLAYLGPSYVYRNNWADVREDMYLRSTQ